MIQSTACGEVTIDVEVEDNVLHGCAGEASFLVARCVERIGSSMVGAVSCCSGWLTELYPASAEKDRWWLWRNASFRAEISQVVSGVHPA